MRWIEATIPTKSDEIDQLCFQLEELGIDGMTIEDENDFRDFLENNRQYWDYVDNDLNEQFKGLSRVKFYLADDEEGNRKLGEIRRALSREIAVSYIADSDWENNWREYYKPLEIGEKLLVVPEWQQAHEDGRVSLILDPGLIFGTGSHATTKMCLCALQELELKGKRVLDLGCGSGILGICAKLFGAYSVTGCDIDPKAPDVALSNAKLNGINDDRFNIYAGDVLGSDMRGTLGTDFDIVLANIVADVIIPLSGIVGQYIKKPGLFICSGIIEGRQDEVSAALEENGFSIVEHKTDEEWHCFVCIYA